MKNENRMSNGQCKFLSKLRDGVWELEELMKWEKVNGAHLARWLQNKFFVQNYLGIEKVSILRGRMELQMGANLARQLLARDVREQKLTLQQIELLRAIILAANQDLRAAKHRRKKKGAAIDPERPLLHPSFAGKESEFLAAMKKAGVKAE